MDREKSREFKEELLYLLKNDRDVIQEIGGTTYLESKDAIREVVSEMTVTLE